MLDSGTTSRVYLPTRKFTGTYYICSHCSGYQLDTSRYSSIGHVGWFEHHARPPSLFGRDDKKYTMLVYVCLSSSTPSNYWALLLARVVWIGIKEGEKGIYNPKVSDSE